MTRARGFLKVVREEAAFLKERAAQNFPFFKPGKGGRCPPYF
jgi:hypothetical protein